MNKFFVIFSTVFLFASNVIVFSQAICPIRTLKVNKINGKILDGGKSEEPLPEIKLELIKFDEEETIVSTVFTDKAGYFEFENIEKGKYGLIIYFVFNGNLYLKYRAIVKAKKTDSPKVKPSILIRFGVDCHETEAISIK